MQMITHYPAIIRQDCGSWIVEFPDFRHINTFGDTLDDALIAAGEALNGCIESDFERGFDFPDPSTCTGGDVFLIPLEPNIALALELRKSRAGRPQVEIARELGISYQAYQRLEHPGKSNPTIKTLTKIAKVLGKNLEIRLN